MALKLINKENISIIETTADVINTGKKFSNEYLEHMVKWWGTWFSTRPYIERLDTASRSMKKNILEALSRDPFPQIKELAGERLNELEEKHQ